MSTLQERLDQYADLVGRYHKALDLMSDAGLRHLPRHIADAVSYGELIGRLAGARPTVIDVGSGAGLPGIVIAAALPAAHVVLVERRRRRAAFLELASANLALGNVDVFAGDVRDLEGVCADVITAQAVADIATVVTLTRHLHRDPCHLISRRGEDHGEAADDIWRAAGLDAGDAPGAAQGRPAGAEVLEEPLKERGSLVAVRLPGGSACQPSA